MTPEEIRIELFKRRKTITMKAIADELGCTGTAVGRVVKGEIVSRRIMEAVARAIDCEKEHVFPEHFIKQSQPYTKDVHSSTYKDNRSCSRSK